MNFETVSIQWDILRYSDNVLGYNPKQAIRNLEENKEGRYTVFMVYN